VEVLVECCAGINIGKDEVVACVRIGPIAGAVSEHFGGPRRASLRRGRLPGRGGHGRAGAAPRCATVGPVSGARADIATSKFLSYVLRHAPETIDLTLDPQGWADIDELLAKARADGHPLDRTALDEVVATSDKKRFTVSADNTRIRAAQGHSVAVDLGIEPLAPPPVLFHGTAVSNLDSIRRDGLRPGRRQKVHLSLDEATAVRVGQRHGKPVVLRVDAAGMHAGGMPFWRAENGVWLTDHVPPEFLQG
jgi:putative RNA 2'-phosphotransferase